MRSCVIGLLIIKAFLLLIMIKIFLLIMLKIYHYHHFITFSELIPRISQKLFFFYFYISRINENDIAIVHKKREQYKRRYE